MTYTVNSKSAKADDKGEVYTLNMESRNPAYQCSILAVTKAQFDSVTVGSEIATILFDVLAPFVPASEPELPA